MPNGNYRRVCDQFEEMGLRHLKDAKIGSVFRLPDDSTIAVSYLCDDVIAKRLVTQVQKALGIATDGDAKKRNPAAIKERQAAERERLAAAIERSTAELARIWADFDDSLNGNGAGLTAGEIAAIERQILCRERELADLQREMTEGPWINAHSGRPKVRHVS